MEFPKTAALAIILTFTAGIAAAEINFRDPVPVDFYNSIDMNSNNLTGVTNINGNTLSELNTDRYIGDSENHKAGGNLNMSGNNITTDSEICIGEYC